MKFDTLSVHGGQKREGWQGSVACPIYQTTAFEFENAQDAMEQFSLQKPGYIYTRLANPTTEVLEERMALLEGGVGSLALSSGQAAILTACLNILNSGDEMISSSSVYGGTYNLFNKTFKKLGISVKFVDMTDINAVKTVINNKTKLVFTEVLGNPKLDIPDFKIISELCHENNIPFMVDNTLLTPALFRPIEFGADIVTHSMSKYLCGHGNALGGIIVDSGNFDWSKGNFPDITEPDSSYNNIKFAEAFGKAAYIVKARAQLLRDIGCTLSPFNAFLTLQGVETLSLRMKKHSENTLKICKFLENHPSVEWVNYPGLESHTSYAMAQKYLPQGQGGLAGFGIKGGFEEGKNFIENLKLIYLATNLGDTRTLASHPASTTHAQMPPDMRQQCGIKDNFIRLSVGIEDVEDIIEDIDRALIEK